MTTNARRLLASILGAVLFLAGTTTVASASVNIEHNDCTTVSSTRLDNSTVQDIVQCTVVRQDTDSFKPDLHNTSPVSNTKAPTKGPKVQPTPMHTLPAKNPTGPEKSYCVPVLDLQTKAPTGELDCTVGSSPASVVRENDWQDASRTPSSTSGGRWAPRAL